MKKKIIIIVVVILLILFVPIRVKHADGGSVEYKALTYRLFKWHKLISNENYYVSTDIYFFPNNFHKFDYYEPIVTPIVSVSSGEEKIDVSTYSYNWSKEYGEEIRYDIGDGSIETVDFSAALNVESKSTLTFESEYDVEDVEYSVYNDDSSQLMFNGLGYDQLTKSLTLPNLEPGDYLINFKLTNEEDYAMYAFKITIQDPNEERGEE